MVNVEDIISIVRSSADMMKSGYADVSMKDGYANIVTSSDIAVQEYLCERLGKLLPGSGFLCEESDINDDGHEYTWIVDPIDGTCNYSRGIAQCAICVGLCHNDDMEIGVVYLPFTGEMFHAERGKGSFLNNRRINVSGRPFEDAVLCCALSVYHKEYARLCSDIILDAFTQCNDIRRFGAAAPELCYLAMGRCELYFEYVLSPWDYAAASLIVTEAGGYVMRADGRHLSPHKPSGIIAANSSESLSRLHDIVQKHESISKHAKLNKILTTS